MKDETHTRVGRSTPPVHYDHEVVTGNGEVDTLLQSVTTEESNRVFDQKLRPPWRNPLGQVRLQIGF